LQRSVCASRQTDVPEPSEQVTAAIRPLFLCGNIPSVSTTNPGDDLGAKAMLRRGSSERDTTLQEVGR
jgi:hypothetical protein